jgi:hypothetical protein
VLGESAAPPIIVSGTKSRRLLVVRSVPSKWGLVVLLAVAGASSTAASLSAQQRDTGQAQLAASAVVIHPREESPVRRAFSTTPPSLTPLQAETLQERLDGVHLPAPSVSSDGQADLAAPAGPPSNPPVRSARGAVATPEAFRFFENTAVGIDGAPLTFKSLTASPDVANADNVVFQTGNFYAARSVDGGKSFNFLDPFLGPFAPVNDGFCCHQGAVYDPNHDALFYLQQFFPDSSTGTHRINVDSGADGSFDCAYDLTPQQFGLASGRWFDFGELVLGTNFLYHTANVADQTPVVTEGFIGRYPLDQISTCASLTATSYEANDRFDFRATRGTGTTVYWGAHNSTTSIRIYRWPETSSTPQFDDRDVAVWPTGTATCAGPDGNDWCGRSTGRILGAYVANGTIGFLWNAPQGGSFPHPHVQFARFQESDRALVQQGQIWSDILAWQYPAVAVNARGHLGGTLLFGGGDSFNGPNCAAWIADDFNGGALAPLTNAVVAIGSSGPSQNVGGDRLGAQAHYPFGNTWVGSCYTQQGGSAAVNVEPRYVWFGRERDESACAMAMDLPAAGGVFPGTTGGTDTDAGTCGTPTGAEAVFRWVPNLSGTATISTCGAGTTFDTVLYVRDTACGTGTEIGCNDNGCSSQSTVTLSVIAGTAYYIFVDGSGGASGNFDLSIVPPAGTPPTADISAAVQLQGRPTPPDPSWSVPLTLTLTPSGGGSPVATCDTTSDQSGNFTCTGLPAGNYVGCVKSPRTLQECVNVTLVDGANSIDFGTLREGDANNDNCAVLIDFSILSSAFGTCIGDPGFDPRGDFNFDGCVLLTDFSLLSSNFGQCGDTPPAAAAAQSQRQAEVGASGATVEVVAPDSVVVGDTFSIQLAVEAGPSPVNGAAAYVAFAPEMVEVLDVTPAGELTMPLDVHVDNGEGVFGHAAGTLGPGMTGRFSLATVFLRVKRAGELVLALLQEPPFATDVTSVGRSVLGRVDGARITVMGDASCAGDCDSDGQVTVDELNRLIAVALGTASLDACLAGDSSGDGAVTIDEINAAVQHALTGCR